MPAKKKYKDFETAIERLEEITTLLESGDESLEDSISLYTEGLEIAGECHKKLESAEKKIESIANKSGVLAEEDFDQGTDI